MSQKKTVPLLFLLCCHSIINVCIIHHLLPPPRDTSVSSRLRTVTPLTRLKSSRTKNMAPSLYIIHIKSFTQLTQNPAVPIHSHFCIVAYIVVLIDLYVILQLFCIYLFKCRWLQVWHKRHCHCNCHRQSNQQLIIGSERCIMVNALAFWLSGREVRGFASRPCHYSTG